jgi:ribosomal protein S27AE
MANMMRIRLECPRCGAEMNHHANKVDYSAGQAHPDMVDPAFNGVLKEVHQCPRCGNVELRRAPEQGR